MPKLFKKHDLVPSTPGNPTHAVPWMPVAIGTANCNRLILWLTQLWRAELLHLVQTAIFYDVNTDTVERVREAVKILKKKLDTLHQAAEGMLAGEK